MGRPRALNGTTGASSLREEKRAEEEEKKIWSRTKDN